MKLTKEEQRIAEKNLNLTYKMASKYYSGNKYLEFDDIRQLASIGIIYAAHRWDKEKGSFSHIAHLAMRAYINRGLPKYREVVCPDRVYGDITKSQRSKIPANRQKLVDEYQNLNFAPILTEDESKQYSGYLEENLAAEDNPNPINLIISKNNINKLNILLQELSPIDQIAIRQKYFDDKQLNEISDYLYEKDLTSTKLSKEAIRQRQVKALKILKEKFNERES